MSTSWQTKRLVEVATLQRGFDLPVQDRLSGDVPLVTSCGISDTHNKSAVQGPGVATGRSGSIGNVFFITDDFWPLNTVLYVKDFHGNVPRFIYYLLKNFNLKRFASGSGVPTLNRNFVHDELVSVPPIPEQKRVADILDEAFERIDIAAATAQKCSHNARAIFNSYLESAFTQGGGDWVDNKLASVTTKIGSGATPRGGEESYKAEGISLIRSLNVHDLGFRYPKLALIDEAQAQELANVEVQQGDVLLNITGASVARCAIVPEDVLPARVNQHVAIIRPIPDKVNADFLHYLLISRPYKDRLLQTGQEGGSTRQAITKSQIENFTVRYPKHLEEQKSIVAKLDALLADTQRLAGVYERKLASLDALKQSLLHHAFAGQL
jgi:type I restriction enzyme S subunit